MPPPIMGSRSSSPRGGTTRPHPPTGNKAAAPTAAGSSRLPVLFLCHGGGPAFFIDPIPGLESLGPGGHLYRSLQNLQGQLSLPRKPKAMLLISAHWEETVPTVNKSKEYKLLYDYYGFPAESYEISYEAKGDPGVASRVVQLLKGSGIEVSETTDRGLDHGVFIPLKAAFPKADIPVVQLSLAQSLDPGLHWQIGEALAPLRDEVLIVGSGALTHNLRALMSNSGGSQIDAPQDWAVDFMAWLSGVIEAPGSSQKHRSELIAAWASAPGARLAQPREDHLLPVVVAAAAGGGPAKKLWGRLENGSFDTSSYLWE